MVGKRINVSITEEAGADLQNLFDMINHQRAKKGLEPVFMREVIEGCISRVSVMPSVYMCGELLQLSEAKSNEPGS